MIDLVPPKTSATITRKIYPDTQYHQQLSIIKSNLLNPVEVTFLNVKNDNETDRRRKRLTTISSESSESFTSTSTVHQTKKKIPDGGYGWVVVFASLMVSLIADGVSFSFGLLYSELLDYFHEGTTKTAWVGSLFMSVPLLAGPIMSNLVDKYGCQRMTMLAGVFGCAGFVLSSVSNSIEVLFFTFGIVSGLGLGVIYVTAVVSIAFWFESKRTFATGIGASGTGLGTFLYAPFTHWLIESYGWRGATLILGGTLLNFAVFGALMIDPEWLIEENKLERRSQSIQTFSNSSMGLDEIKKLLETGAPKEDVLDTLVTNYNTEANQQILDFEIVAPKKYRSELLLPTFLDANNDSGIKSSSRRSLHPDKLKSPETISRDELLSPLFSDYASKKEKQPKQCQIASVETLNSSEKETCEGRQSLNDFDSISLNISLDENRCNFADSDEGFVTNKRSGRHGSRFSLNDTIISKRTPYDALKEDFSRSFRGNSLNIVYENESFQPNFQSSPTRMPLGNSSDAVVMMPHSFTRNKHPRKKQSATMPIGNLKKNSSLKYSNYLKNMRVHRNSMATRGAMLNTHRYRLKASSCPNIFRNSMTTIAQGDDELWYDDFVDIIKSIFDFSLFLEYKFGMMSLSTLFLFVWYIIPYFYITELLSEFNYSEESCAYLISVIGIFNTLGMIVLGWIGDQKWCDVTKCYSVCLFLCGISMFLIPFAVSSYPALVVLCGLFGVTFASSFSFTPIITSRLVDMDDFTLAYGLILLVQGVGSLVGPPLAGFIYDLTNRWDDAFYAGGIFIFASGLCAAAFSANEESGEADEDMNNNEDKVDRSKGSNRNLVSEGKA